MRSNLILLVCVLALGLFLRIYRLAELPMYGDELTLVYDSYSILKTGMDSTGERFPLTFRMGAGRPGGYIYGSIPFVAIFGPTELGVRALSLLSGMGVIALVYFLGKKIFDEKVGLLAAFLVAISPWDIYLSRGGFEAHFALFLALLGITAFLYRKYLLWAIGWDIALHTYPTFKLTLPLLLPLLLWFSGDFKKILRNKMFLVGVVLLMLFGGFAARETLTKGSEERFLRINVFADQNLREQIIQRVNAERTLSTLPDVLKQIFHNRILEYSRQVLENYMDNISFRFLYLRGDGNPRHNPGEWGMLYLIELPLLFAAIAYMWRDKKRELTFLLAWILIIPLASMFLDPGTGTGHSLRNAAMLPPLILLSAFAISKLPAKIRMIVIVLILVQLVVILQRVYFLAPGKFASFWSTEAKKASLVAVAASANTKVVLSTKIDNIEYAYPVYAKIDPRLVIAQYGKYPKVYGNVVITDK